MFLAHKNAVFAADAELAVRGAIFAMIASAPFIVPSLGWLVQSGRYSSFAVVMFVFTLYKSVGETVNFAFVGMVGTFLAVLNAWCMNGFFPGGVQHDGGPNFLPGVIDMAVFTIVILSLNVDIGLRMFALSWHMYFMMSFLTPSSSGWSDGFEIDIHGPAISALLQSGIGAGLAVIASLFPFPIFALDKARATSIKLTQEIAEGFATCVDCYCAPNKRPILEDKARHSMTELRDIVQDLRAHIANSWWECFGIGRPQRVRVFLGQLDHTFRELYNKMCAIMHSIEMEQYDTKHVQTMGALRPSLSELVTEAGTMLMMVTQAASDGLLDEQEIVRLDDQQRRTTSAIEKVSLEFSNRYHGKLDISLVDENAFCLSCCSFGRLAVNFVDELKETQSKPVEKELASPFTAFKIPLGCEIYRNAILRNSISIFASFIVGYCGRGDIIQSYNSGPAGTVALLISTGFGSAVVKNLNRLQGVVLGTFFGQLAYALLAWCTMGGYISVGVFVFAWLLVSLFTYYNSVQFSGVACLLAAFGVQGVLLGCSDEIYNPSGTTQLITNTVLGVTFMTLSDQLFALKSASKHAHTVLLDAWASYREGMMEIMEPETTQVRRHSGDLMTKISSSAAAADLADMEPRIWKTPFKRLLFGDVVNGGHRLRESLCCLETTCSVTGTDDAPKARFLKNLGSLPSYQAVVTDFKNYADAVEGILDIFVHETDDCFHSTMGIKPSEGKSPIEIARANLVALVRELESFLDDPAHQQEAAADIVGSTSARGSKFKNLEDNILCKVSVFVFALTWQFEVLYDVKHRILSE
jgi:hypothetical protein